MTAIDELLALKKKFLEDGKLDPKEFGLLCDKILEDGEKTKEELAILSDARDKAILDAKTAADKAEIDTRYSSMVPAKMLIDVMKKAMLTMATSMIILFIYSVLALAQNWITNALP